MAFDIIAVAEKIMHYICLVLRWWFPPLMHFVIWYCDYAADMQRVICISGVKPGNLHLSCDIYILFWLSTVVVILIFDS